jgi:hypothetical protein
MQPQQPPPQRLLPMRLQRLHCVDDTPLLLGHDGVIHQPGEVGEEDDDGGDVRRNERLVEDVEGVDLAPSIMSMPV